MWGERKDPKDILERFGRIKRSKRYPRKILVRTENPKISSKDLVRTENPKDILERFGGGQKIQKLS